MSRNPTTRLDFPQVIKRVYDEDTESLRTNVQAVISDVTINVDTDASEDSIAVGDPDNGNTLKVNADGSINVITGSVESTRIVSSNYNEITGVATGVTSMLCSYIASANDFLQKIEFSGTNIAEFELVINGITQDKKRTYFGSALNGNFDFNNGINLPAGQSVIIYVVHNRPTVGDFNARIQVINVS